MAVLASVSLLGGCAARPQTIATVYGDSVVEVAGPMPNIAHELFRRIGNESFSASSNEWSRQGDQDDPAQTIGRGTARTHDAAGKPIELEFIRSPSRPTLIFIHYEGEGGSMRIMNELLRDLQKQGVTIR